MSLVDQARARAFGHERTAATTDALNGRTTFPKNHAPLGPPEPDDAKGFLHRLWGGDHPDEHKAIVVIERGGPTPHAWDTTVSRLVGEVAAADAGSGEVYHGCAVYKSAGERYRGRSGDRALGCYAWWQDIDVGKAGDSPGDIAAARRAIVAACSGTGLPHPAVVASGSGLHIYWFTGHLVLANDWQRVALKLLLALSKAGLHVDRSRATDITSILRPPGSTWKKPLYDERHRAAEIRTVRWLVDAPNIDAERFEAILDAYEEPSAAARLLTTGIDNGDLAGGTAYAPCSIREAEKSCGFLQRVRGDAVILPEPEWKLAASLAARAEHPEGREWFHEVSIPYPGYSATETDRKFDQCATPPPLCKTISRAFPGCAKCMHFGRVSTPLDLGRAQSEQRQNADGPALEVRLDQHDEPVAKVKIGSRSAFVPLESRFAKDELITQLAAQRGRAPSHTVINLAESHIRRAASSMPRVHLKPRITCIDQGFAIDMMDGRCICIRSGRVTVESGDDVPFKYIRGAGQLPEPDLNWPGPGDALNYLEDWLDELGIPAALRRPLVAALLLTITPVDGVTYLLVQWTGAAGSGKTTVAQLIASLVDPVEGGDIPDARLDDDSLLAAAQARSLIFMDNVGSLSGDVQDTLCKCATGTRVITRRLYSNADAFMAPLHAPVMITSVSDIISRHDLRDRTLTIPIERTRGDFLSKEEVRERFKARHPRLLGALVYLGATVLRDRPTVRSQQRWTHRLTDWLIAGEIVGQASGDTPGMFVDLAQAAQRQAAVAGGERDAWLAAFLQVLKNSEGEAAKQDDFDGYRQWSSKGKTVILTSAGGYSALFRPMSLLDELRRVAEYRSVPDSPLALNRAIEQWRPTLKALGISEALKRPVNGDHTKAWRFAWTNLEGGDA